jgi:hypothetical protein
MSPLNIVLLSLCDAFPLRTLFLRNIKWILPSLTQLNLCANRSVRKLVLNINEKILNPFVLEMAACKDDSTVNATKSKQTTASTVVVEQEEEVEVDESVVTPIPIMTAAVASAADGKKGKKGKKSK